ncbi:MAG: hypothetical protein AB1305_00765 [Candidatus Hadarchaeota archaeon]
MTVNWLPEAVKKLEKLSKRDPLEYKRIKKGFQRFAAEGGGDLVAIKPPIFRLRIGSWRFWLHRTQAGYDVVDFYWRDQAYRLEVIERMLRRARLL